MLCNFSMICRIFCVMLKLGIENKPSIEIIALLETLFCKYEKTISVPIKILPGFLLNSLIILRASLTVLVDSLSI